MCLLFSLATTNLWNVGSLWSEASGTWLQELGFRNLASGT